MYLQRKAGREVSIDDSPELGRICNPDSEPPSDEPDEATEENGRVNWIHRRKDVALVRLKDCGLTCRDSDRDGDDMQRRARTEPK